MKDRDHNRRQTQDRGREQRQHTRHTAAAVPDLSAFIRRGQAVRLIDISKRGALIESDARLCPGRTVSLRFVTPDTEVSLTGCVIRSSVSGLSDRQLIYRTALSFNQDNPLFERSLKEHVSPPADTAVAATDLNSEEEPILELVAAVHQSASELTAMFTTNER